MVEVYFQIFLRTFLVQTLWNYERMQNIGFLFILKPFLDKVYIDKDKKKEAFLRHTVYFNIQSYMVGVVVAVVANLERKIAEGGINIEKLPNVNGVKSSMAGPLAALGDSFFFGTLRPAISFISISLLILFVKIVNNHFVNYGILIPLVFIVFYNVVHIAFRYWLLFIGFRFDKKSVNILSNFKFLLTLTRYIGLITAIAAFVLYLMVFGFDLNGVFFGNKVYDILGCCVVFACSIVVSCKFGVIFLFYGVVLTCILISYLGI